MAATSPRAPERFAVLALLFFAGFVLLAAGVITGSTLPLDEFLLRAFRNPGDLASPIGPVWLQGVARDITALGSMTVLIFGSLALLGFFWLEKRRDHFFLLLGAVTGGVLASNLLKGYFARPRPELVAHLTPVLSLSFPSGHSMMSAITYLTLGVLLARTTINRWLRAYYLTVAALLVVLIGLSRIYLGVHYPSDVMAGWCLGAAWALACSAFPLARRS